MKYAMRTRYAAEIGYFDARDRDKAGVWSRIGALARTIQAVLWGFRALSVD
jgi:hypothetical protein